jgi:hypothetical protein
MLALLQLLLIGVLAYQLQGRAELLESFKGLPRYLCSLGLTLFLATWANFLFYVVFGWGGTQQLLSWAALVLPLAWFLFAPNPGTGAVPAASPSAPSSSRGNGWFLFLAGFVVIRFATGLIVDRDGNIWTNFNFVDTAFHLSVANAFLAAPHFPPVDLDMAPFPLKYHFLADFQLAHLVRLGLSPLKAIWLMNLISAAAMVGAVWAAFERWLRLPPRWVMLGAFIFLCLNPALLNFIHYLALHPPYFNPDDPFYGIVRFPYFNFEFSLTNLLEPQRGLLFSLPVALLILHGTFGDGDAAAPGPLAPRDQTRTLQSFCLVCLLPLAHVVAFAVLALALAPKLWRHRGWFFARGGWWLPLFAVGLLQLFYLLFYGPAGNPAYSGWDVALSLPLGDFSAFPAFTRRIVFWFFVDGDFLFWGLLFAGLALARRPAHPGGSDQSPPLRNFLRQWQWYFAACGFCFALINVYRYSFTWGDSNKFMLFVNLGLSLVIVLGAAQWPGRRQVVARALWWFFLILCVAPPAFEFYREVASAAHGKILMFHRNARAAAAWLRANTEPSSVVLTSAYNDIHFVTALAGRRTLAGIYGDSNPYRRDEQRDEIRRTYEQADFASLRLLQARYVCISGYERLKYKLDPKWTDLMTSGTAVLFHVGGGPDDHDSVYIFDATQLR